MKNKEQINMKEKILRLSHFKGHQYSLLTSTGLSVSWNPYTPQWVLSSGIWHSVAWKKFIDFLKECTVSIAFCSFLTQCFLSVSFDSEYQGTTLLHNISEHLPDYKEPKPWWQYSSITAVSSYYTQTSPITLTLKMLTPKRSFSK
jgi:hypothetical protein